MSFVSKGEKKMRNMAKKAGPGADKAAAKDSFGKKGQPTKHNQAPGSKDRASEPVSEDWEDDKPSPEKTVKSEYDPASGKRAGSIADLRNAAKLISQRSDAGEASPTGSEGAEEDKHGSSKNTSGFMGSGSGKKAKMPKAGAQADQMKDEMEDPMDESEEDSGEAEEGMTPSGKSRKSGLKALKKKLAM